MPTNYPASLDSLTNPTSSDTLATVPHDSQHANANDAIEALQTKLGTGASTPVTAGHVLQVTGPGATAYAALSGLLDWVDVQADYGAAGDGSTDDTTAIQNALNAIDAAGGGTLYFPRGTYVITAELNYAGSFLHIIGAGTAYGGSIIKQTTVNLGVFNFTEGVTSEQRSAQPPLIQQIVLRGTGFDDTGTLAGTWQWNEASTAGDGIYALADVWLQNVSIEGFYNGVNLGTDSWYSRIENSILWQNAGNGVLIADGNNLSLTNCRFGFNGQDLWAEDVWGLRAVGCSFEQQRTGHWSVVLDDNGINGTRGILFAGCYFETEQGLGALRIGDTGTIEAVEVVGCIFGNVSPTGYKQISINFADRVTISGCEIGTTGAGGVPIDASTTNTTNLVLVNNDISGTPTNLPATTQWIDPTRNAWTSYTPTWSSNGSQPSIGDGTLTGRYKHVDEKLVEVIIHMVIGSTTNVGTGTWRWSLPFTAGSLPQLGTALIIDAGTRYYTGTALVAASGTVVQEIQYNTDASGAATVTSIAPVGWATGDEVQITLLLEKA